MANLKHLTRRCHTFLKWLHIHAGDLPFGPERDAWKSCADMLQCILETPPEQVKRTEKAEAF